jgi:hypothetical protein
MTRITRAALLRRALPASLGAGLLPAPAVRAQAPIEITYYHWQTGVAGRSLRGLLDAFQAENPGILVRDIFKQSDQITAEIQSVVAARRPLDVAQVLGRNVLFIKANLPVVPLDEDRAAGEWLGRFAPNFLGLGDRGGRPYAMPHSFGTPVAYLNLDLLAQAGISTPPATWADATAAALAVRERTGRAGIAHIQTGNRDYGVMTLVLANGGRYLSPDGRRALFNSPEGIAALQLWGDLVARHRVHPVANDQQLTAAFRDTRVGEPITVEGYFRRADGRRTPVSLRIGAFLFGGERFLVTLARDVSERVELEGRLRLRTEELDASLADLKRTQKELVQREKLSALGPLVAGVAHEVNTPLGVALTALSLADDGRARRVV